MEKAKENKCVNVRNKKHKAKLDEIDKIKKQKLNVENAIFELQNKIENEILAAEKTTTKKKILRLSRRLHLLFEFCMKKKRIIEIAKSV